MSAFAFAQPLLLFGLLALPVIWWLLRMTPPRPTVELFPPLRILASVLKSEETPHKSPWWLTLLRLMLAALVILALAEPVHNPRASLHEGGGALAIAMDNGWAATPDWDQRVATARRLIEEAARSNNPVLLAFTAERANSDIGPFEASEAIDRLDAARPRPVPPRRAEHYDRLAAAVSSLAPGATLALLVDGIAAEEDAAGHAALAGSDFANLIWIAPEAPRLRALTAADNEADAMRVAAIRADAAAAEPFTVAAFDEQGRRISEAAGLFAAGQTRTVVDLAVPFELRNDFRSLVIDGERQAAALRLLDEQSMRRRVGLLSATGGDAAQPLLSPLYYIRRALAPHADLIEADTSDLSIALPDLIQQGPATIILSDIGTIPEPARGQLIEWLENGGTLLRFAGSRLAAAENDDDLLPVRLRIGERELSGTLSWSEPQPIAEFPAHGPFFDLAPPREVLVRRQVLAEPTSDIVERSWANLADGTPLITGVRRGEGTLVLVHVPPDASWSDLPISGTFVDMLTRIVQMSRNQGSVPAGVRTAAALSPLRMISAEGGMTPPPPDARPLTPMPGGNPVTLDNPPGLYGNDAAYLAHNLLPADATLEPMQQPAIGLPVRVASYFDEAALPLKGMLLTAAAALLALDFLAMFWLGGMFARRATTALLVIVLAGASLPDAAQAQNADGRPGDAEAIAAIARTRIAYVLTGNDELDAVSRAGLSGLNRFLLEKTALEPGEPAGVDIARDELAFYPLVYWPVDPDMAAPEPAAIARIDAYMQQGGTVLFDTRDQFSSQLSGAGASPATLRLREILSGLNVPPLEPVPDDHVLTKSFYILREFPGRYAEALLWVEAMPAGEQRNDRPVRSADGVSPILITSADFAAAWAMDDEGVPLFPTVPPEPMQRILSLRAGVNIMMYMLTGNYKSDQVHVPILLERLGQ